MVFVGSLRSRHVMIVLDKEERAKDAHSVCEEKSSNAAMRIFHILLTGQNLTIQPHIDKSKAWRIICPEQP